MMNDLADRRVRFPPRRPRTLAGAVAAIARARAGRTGTGPLARRRPSRRARQHLPRARRLRPRAGGSSSERARGSTAALGSDNAIYGVVAGGSRRPRRRARTPRRRGRGVRTGDRRRPGRGRGRLPPRHRAGAGEPRRGARAPGPRRREAGKRSASPPRRRLLPSPVRLAASACLAGADLTRGRPADAVAIATRALAVPAEPVDTALVRYALARATWSAGDRASSACARTCGGRGLARAAA